MAGNDIAIGPFAVQHLRSRHERVTIFEQVDERRPGRTKHAEQSDSEQRIDDECDEPSRPRANVDHQPRSDDDRRGNQHDVHKRERRNFRQENDDRQHGGNENDVVRGEPRFTLAQRRQNRGGRGRDEKND